MQALFTFNTIIKLLCFIILSAIKFKKKHFLRTLELYSTPASPSVLSTHGKLSLGWEWEPFASASGPAYNLLKLCLYLLYSWTPIWLIKVMEILNKNNTIDFETMRIFAQESYWHRNEVKLNKLNCNSITFGLKIDFITNSMRPFPPRFSYSSATRMSPTTPSHVTRWPVLR